LLFMPIRRLLMKRLLCGTLTVIFMSLPLYANTPNAGSSQSADSMNTEATPAGSDIQRMEEDASRSDTESVSGESDEAQLQQAPADSTVNPSGMESSTPAEETQE